MNVNETLGNQSQQRATLEQGVEVLGKDQTVTFTKYTKVILSADGFVFWVATAETMTATGALHLAVDRHQDHDQTIGANQVIFTSEKRVDAFDFLSPTTMWIGSWPLGDQNAPVLQIAFARRDYYFDQSDLWHYAGFAVFPALASQIVQTAADLPKGPIVSNSLPIWLTLNLINAQTLQTVPVYPAFLVSDNLEPPYIAVNIEDERTEALAAAPTIIPPGVEIPGPIAPFYNFPSSQEYRDEVELTLYGFNNEMAWQYLMSLYDASLNGNDGLPLFGFANSPAIRDAKRTQVEIAALAQKKTIRILANYNSGTADAIARRYILSASLTISLGSVPP